MDLLHLLIEFVVVLCELYIVVWIVSFFLGLVNAAWRWPMFPVGPAVPGSVGSVIVAIAVVVVFGGYHL